MITIYKYPIHPTSNPSIVMPKDAKILTFQSQYDKPFIWALVDTDKQTEQRNFILLATGEPIDNALQPYAISKMSYIGTALFGNDNLVFHLFELLK